MAGSRIGLVLGVVLLVTSHQFARGLDMCDVTPIVRVNTSVSTDAIILQEATSNTGEGCVQYCCGYDKCSAAVFIPSSGNCKLVKCPSQGSCVGKPAAGATLYLLPNGEHTGLLNNQIRQLNDSTASTTAAPATGANTTPTSTQGANTTLPPVENETTTTPTPKSDATTTSIPKSENTTNTAITSSDATSTTKQPPVQVSGQTSTQNDLTPAGNTTPPSSLTSTPKPDISTASVLPPPSPTEAGNNATEPTSTITTSNQSTTEAPVVSETPAGTEAPNVTTQTTPNISTAAPVNSNATTGKVSDTDNKEIFPEKRHWPRDWRRKHYPYREHLPVKHPVDSSALDDILSDIFGGGGGDDDKFGGGPKVAETNSRHWDGPQKPDHVQQKPGLFVPHRARFKHPPGDTEGASRVFHIPPDGYPVRHPSKSIFLTPPPLPPYPVPHKIGVGITPAAKGATTQQPATGSPGNTSSPPVNGTAATSPPPPTTTTVSNGSVAVATTVPSQTSTAANVTESPSPAGSPNVTTGSDTGSPPVTTGSDTTTSATVIISTSGKTPYPVNDTTPVPTDLPTTGPTGTTGSSTLVSVESTPLISVNDSLADIAIEANDRAMSAALIAALSFGILFFAAVIVLLTKRLYDGWQRRHYSRVDYLVNGMYN